MKAISVDPRIVQHTVNELDQDQRSVFIERTYESLHRMLGQLIEKDVRRRLVARRLECQAKAERLMKCFDARRRCWACEDCHAMLRNSYIKINSEFFDLQNSLIETLVDVEIDFELLRRRRWPA